MPSRIARPRANGLHRDLVSCQLYPAWYVSECSAVWIVHVEENNHSICCGKTMITETLFEANNAISVHSSVLLQLCLPTAPITAAAMGSCSTSWPSTSLTIAAPSVQDCSVDDAGPDHRRLPFSYAAAYHENVVSATW